jgi:hypothetical protein
MVLRKRSSSTSLGNPRREEVERNKQTNKQKCSNRIKKTRKKIDKKLESCV